MKWIGYLQDHISVIEGDIESREGGNVELGVEKTVIFRLVHKCFESIDRVKLLFNPRVISRARRPVVEASPAVLGFLTRATCWFDGVTSLRRKSQHWPKPRNENHLRFSPV